MTEQSIAITTKMDASALEAVLIGGDLSKLSPAQRVQYYKSTCESLGLNPLTKPFDYITLNNKMTLYTKKDAADQLRKIHNVSIEDVDIQEVGDTYVVKVKGRDLTGRSDVEFGVVKKSDMQGNIANAQMKAVTKAKRRLTLSLCGLGWLDETEVETIPDARPVKIDTETGEIMDVPAVEIPEGYEPKVCLEMALAEKNSKGVAYGDLDPKMLKIMYNKMSSLENKTDDHLYKMECIRTILHSQEG